jgi:hypothetical protein
MIFNTTIFSNPKFPGKISSWIEHIPFAFFLTDALKPKVFVELGTHFGASYFAFCQAIEQSGLKTKAFAVDHWQGDEHAGLYDKEVFEYVSKINNQAFSHFSNLLKMSFDEANKLFDDGSIDLLHIDGLHTYEAVKHDYELWLPKMSEKGVVIFHDTAVKEGDFGVWRLMDELKTKFPYFEFSHGYGLGVLCTGKKVHPDFLEFVKMAGDDGFTQKLFESIGKKIGLEQQNLQQKDKIEQQGLDIENSKRLIKIKDSEYHNLQQTLQETLDQKEQQSISYQHQLANAQSESETRAGKIKHLKLLLTQITKSPSWKLTAPLRYLKKTAKSSAFFLCPE